jgi:hypothetical protein
MYTAIIEPVEVYSQRSPEQSPFVQYYTIPMEAKLSQKPYIFLVCPSMFMKVTESLSFDRVTFSGKLNFIIQYGNRTVMLSSFQMMTSHVNNNVFRKPGGQR